jgi:hypothetical protein
MQRADSAQIRKALEAVDLLVKAGVLFVPIPILDDRDHALVVDEMNKRFEIMITSTEGL